MQFGLDTPGIDKAQAFFGIALHESGPSPDEISAGRMEPKFEFENLGQAQSQAQAQSPNPRGKVAFEFYI